MRFFLLSTLLLTAAAGAQPLRTPAEVGPRADHLFREMGKVLQHARCVNCHPSSARPLQGEDGRPHEPPVQRGPDGHGLPGMRCAACHASANYDPAKIPGDPHWHLAPASMAWQGKTLGEICRQLKDPSRNGGKGLDGIVAHLATDPLVGWAWKPGAGREPAPGSQAQLKALAEAWVEAGAGCPD